MATKSAERNYKAKSRAQIWAQVRSGFARRPALAFSSTPVLVYNAKQL